jgi:hypothetical protein
MIEAQAFEVQFLPCEFIWKPWVVKWSRLVLIEQTCTWLWIFIDFCNFLLKKATSLLTQDEVCKSKGVVAHVTIRLVFTVELANREIDRRPILVSFLQYPLFRHKGSLHLF